MKTFFKTILSIIAILLLALLLIYLFTDHKKLRIFQNHSTKLYEPNTTTLNFPLLISINDLEKLANAKIKTVMLDKRIPLKTPGDTLILKITRLGKLNISLENQFFNSSVPLKLEIQYIKKIIGKTKVEFFKKEPLQLKLTAYFRSSLDLQEDMKIKSSSKLTEIRWHEDPNVKILGIEFNLKEKINQLLFEKSGEVAAKIDGLIRNKINLKKPTLKIWNNIQKSIPANKKQKDLYVRIQPQNLSVFVDKSLGDSLKLNLVVNSKIFVRFAKDTADIKRVNFPKKISIIRKKDIEKISNLHLHFLFPLEDLNAILNRELTGKTLKAQGLSVKIKSVEIMNGQRNIYVKIKHTGDISGEIIVKGMPKLSDDKRTLLIQNVAFENKLDDDVANSLTDILHSQILGLLKQYVKFDVGSAIESIPDFARKAIKKSKLSKKAEIELQHLEVDKIKIKLTRDNVQLIVSGHSSFEIALKKESFKLKK